MFFGRLFLLKKDLDQGWRFPEFHTILNFLALEMQLLYLLNILIFLLILNLPELFSGCTPSKKNKTCKCGQYRLTELINLSFPSQNQSQPLILEITSSEIVHGRRGTISSVCHAYWPQQNNCYALKKYNRSLQLANNEIEVLEYFNTLNDNERNHIIKIQGSSIDNPPNNNNVLKYIVMDLAGMNLEEYYNNNFNENDRELLIINIIKCAAKALEQFHKHGIHLDIKATNFVLPYGKQSLELCILIDFSGSVITKGRKIEVDEFVGTLPYIPPEYYNKQIKNFHPSFDIYSFGVMMYKFLKNIREDRFEVNLELVTTNEYLDQLAKDCMNENPRLRPSISQILEILN
ncbi:Protein kinase domain-containing protein [Meloidogyne graminicola]|uniref:Protein kinase domain-containing protein n=1 Tax=Meloidogyne graminicola TaxID=189291 RepID=A0A8S9ZLP8_9BILA|nr:Protein kinase domain-containing protein [Meloidogyne graminicola]